MRNSIGLSDLFDAKGRLKGYLRYAGPFRAGADLDPDQDPKAILVHLRGPFRDAIPYHLGERDALNWLHVLESYEDEVHSKDKDRYVKCIENTKIAVVGVREDRLARGLLLETDGL